MTKNKVILFTSIVAALVITNYLYFQKKGKSSFEKIAEYNEPQTSLPKDPKSDLPQSGGAAQEVDDLSQSSRVSYQDQNAESVDKGQNQKDFELFEKLEEDWINKIKSVFPKEKMFQVYLLYREESEKEKMEAYEEFHRLMEKKFGPNYTYSLSEDQTKFEQKINDKYLKKLKDMMGEKPFSEYLKTRDQFNEEILRRTKGQKPLLIEF